VREWFSPPALGFALRATPQQVARDAEFAERNSFFFSGDPVSYGTGTPEKKRSNRVMVMKIMVTPIKTCFEQHSLLPQSLLLFVFLPLKGNQIKQ